MVGWLISGVAAGAECLARYLASLLRPLDGAAGPLGHFHAAAFFCVL